MQDKRAQAEASLPENQRATFARLVEDYKASAEAHTGQVWVNYKILADLVRAGWRRQEQ
jgi:hypothetical protein